MSGATFMKLGLAPTTIINFNKEFFPKVIDLVLSLLSKYRDCKEVNDCNNMNGFYVYLVFKVPFALLFSKHFSKNLLYCLYICSHDIKFLTVLPNSTATSL